jgi:hypothetical protein
MEDGKKMNLHQKILQIMREVQRIQKDDHVEFKTTKYKALSEEKVTSIMREKMIDYSLVVYPIKQDWSRQGNITHVYVTYRLVDTESGDSIEIVSCGDGADTQDKGSGKAMTYAFKYMWLRTFAIPTGEDPDKICNEEILARQAAEKEKVEEKDVEILKKILKPNQIKYFLDYYKVENLESLTKAQYGVICQQMKKKQEMQNGDKGKDK